MWRILRIITIVMWGFNAGVNYVTFGDSWAFRFNLLVIIWGIFVEVLWHLAEKQKQMKALNENEAQTQQQN